MIRVPVGRLVFFASLLGLVTSTSFGQTAELDQLLQIGTPTNSTTLSIPMGVVNLANGNLHLEIPIKTIPQAGSLQPIKVSLVYDSQFWELFSTSTSSFWTPSPHVASSWRLIISPSMSYVTEQEVPVIDTFPACNPTGQSTVPSWQNFSYTEPSGTTHVFPELNFQQSSPCSVPTGVAFSGEYASDNSGYFMYVTTDTLGGIGGGNIQVWDPDGNMVYTGTGAFGGGTTGSTYEDRNGNLPINNFVVASADGTANIPGFTQTPVTYHVNTHFNPNNFIGVSDYNDTLTSLGSLTLPDGSAYSFVYDQCPGSGPCDSTDYHHGLLKSMTLPTGATITFNYQTIDLPQHFSYDVSDLRVTSVSLSGESLSNCADPTSWSGQTWSLCYHLTPLESGLSATTEIDVLQPSDIGGVKNQIKYTGGSVFSAGLAPATFIPGSRSICQGICQDPTTMQSDVYSYDSLGRINEVATRVDGTFASDIKYGYWGPHLPMISSKKELDQAGNILRETDATFTTNYIPQPGCGACTNFAHFIDKPLTRTIFGVGGAASNTPAAGTIYSYDDYPVITLSGNSGQSVMGLPSHDDANFGSGQSVRGNLTSVSGMISPGQFITLQTNHYNILGQMVSSTDGNLQTTNYDYHSTVWGDSACAASTAFSYQATITNPMGQVTKISHNSCDGTIHSVKDPNDIAASRDGTVYTYDTMERLTKTSYPDGGSITTTYVDSNHITSNTSMDALQTVATSQQLDGLGRVIRTVGADNSIVDTTYDAFGHVASVATPHRSVPLPKDPPTGLTSYRYDPLGRTTFQCQPDNGNNNPCLPGVSYRQWIYAGTQTTRFDEARNQWQETSDNLGRLIKVIEPGNQETDYGYNELGSLVSATQKGNGLPSNQYVSRGFSYDGLGRLIKANNSETGIVCYGIWSSGNCVNGYDSNGNLRYKTDQRGLTIHYSYDSLDRLVSKTYVGSGTAPSGQPQPSDVATATPSSCFQYDSSSSDPTQANFVGRLGSQWTQLGSCSSSVPSTGYITSHSVLSYDEMGRAKTEQRCTLGSCNTLTSKYDYVGHLTNYDNGLGTLSITNSYDSAARLYQITSSVSDPTHPQTLYSVSTFNPGGALEAGKLGGNISIYQTFDVRFRHKDFSAVKQ